MEFYDEEQSDVIIKNLDHLGLVAGMVDELGIVETIDALIPCGDDRILSHGEGAKAMILNGLGYVNKQLYQTPKFFEDKPLKRLFGKEFEASQINADSLSRTLDAFYTYGVTELFGKIAAKAVEVLGLTCKQLHLDSTSFHLDGVYATTSADEMPETEMADSAQQSTQTTPSPITITHGYSRDHRPDLPQVVLNLVVENEAGIPLLMQPLSGNSNDKESFQNVIKEHIASLANATASSILVADAALYSSVTITLLDEQHRPFISRVPAQIKEAKTLIGSATTLEFTPIDDNYRYHEIKSTYGNVSQRWLLIQSSAAKSRDDHANLRKIQKMLTQEQKNLSKLSKARFACHEDAQSALEAFGKTLQAHEVVFSDITLNPRYEGKGRPGSAKTPIGYDYGIGVRLEPSAHYAEVLDAQSGLFILATTTELTPEAVLREYKAQQRVERGFRFLKSPEFLSDAFYLKKAERIEALLMIMTLCLLVYAALEHRSRSVLKNTEAFFPDLKGKPTQTPTSRWIFASFFAIHVFHMNGSGEQITGMKPFQKRLLELLGSGFMRYYRRGT
jgi:transposase